MRQRRGFIILTVLVVVIIALLVATGTMFMVQAEVSGAHATRGRVQSRSIGLGAVRVIMDAVDEQRDDLLEGILPELQDEYVLYETADRLGVVRLIPMGMQRTFIVPESAKLDLNVATEEMLAAMEPIGPQLARAIITYRDGLRGQRFQSELELLNVEGISPEKLYGPIDLLTPTDDVQYPDGAGLGERIETRLGGAQPDGLLDLLTVFSFEPALQRSGRLRINLNTPWSSELGERVDERFGDGTATVLEELFKTYSFTDDSIIVKLLNDFDVPATDWPDIIDALSATPDQFHYGRVNINHAPYDVLTALPGIDEEIADTIVEARDQLTDDERATVAWLPIQQVLETDACVDLAEWTTARSWTFRMRIAAGEVPIDEPDGPIDHPVLYEIVIDCSAPRARLAYLRDITLLQTAGMMALRSDDAAGFDGASDDEFAPWDDEFGVGDDASSFDDEALADEEMGFPASDSDIPFDDDDLSFGDDEDDEDDADADSDADASRRSSSGASGQGTGGGRTRGRVGRWTAGR